MGSVLRICKHRALSSAILRAIRLSRYAAICERCADNPRGETAHRDRSDSRRRADRRLYRGGRKRLAPARRIGAGRLRARLHCHLAAKRRSEDSRDADDRRPGRLRALACNRPRHRCVACSDPGGCGHERAVLARVRFTPHESETAIRSRPRPRVTAPDSPRSSAAPRGCTSAWTSGSTEPTAPIST